jgi:hypothetical protein
MTGDLQIGNLNDNGVSSSSKTKFRHNLTSQRLELSENTGAWRKIPKELKELSGVDPSLNPSSG